MEEKVPLPNTSRPVKQTAAKHTRSKEAVRERILHLSLGPPHPRRPGGGKGRRPRYWPRTRWPALELERTRLLGQNKARNALLSRPPAPGQGWGRSQDRKAPLRQIFSSIRMWRKPAHHIPLANLDKKRTSFQHHSCSPSMACIVGTHAPAPELVLCPGQSLSQGTWAQPPPSLASGSIPKVLPKSPAEEVAPHISGGTELEKMLRCLASGPLTL
uniref:Uncharacterized protein n=1 Tax=Molossus molossus TaxID=27622 RepID=A0A7J8HIP6_MOLMO|nr:hypothetical protein HJG59_010933 [Molossus molossus]